MQCSDSLTKSVHRAQQPHVARLAVGGYAPRMTSEAKSSNIFSSFWTPLCAIGAHDDQRANAQICVSVFGASIVPAQPRLLVVLTKTNYTHDLVKQSGTLAITLLSSEQLYLLEPLGLISGRDQDKLAGLERRLTASGDPYFLDGVAYFSGETLDAFDFGDSTAFLVAVRTSERLSELPPMDWADARRRVGSEFMQRWAEKSQREQNIAQRLMVWR